MGSPEQGVIAASSSRPEARRVAIYAEVAGEGPELVLVHEGLRLEA